MIKQVALALLMVTMTVPIFAQEKTKEYPKPEAMRPAMTEFWTPQPKIVTPGDDRTNTAPSDAIVLFDGTDLNAWKNERGGEAGWTVHDGVFTVDKSKGDILTKQSFGSFQLHLEWCVPINISGEWNVYDIIYNAPVFNNDGTFKVHPTVTVIQGTTEYIGHPRVVPHGDEPIRLQMHGDPSEPISFRNIWLREI